MPGSATAGCTSTTCATPHGVWLIAQHVPVAAIAPRLGHANPLITKLTYAHIYQLVDQGLFTPTTLGLNPSHR